MSRIKRGKGHLKRRKYLLKDVKGYQGGRKKLIKLAKTARIKAGAYAYADRRVKKRVNRQLWQVNINAGARALGISYSRLIYALKSKKIGLDRKILAELAGKEPKVFAKIVESAKSA